MVRAFGPVWNGPLRRALVCPGVEWKVSPRPDCVRCGSAALDLLRRSAASSASEWRVKMWFGSGQKWPVWLAKVRHVKSGSGETSFGLLGLIELRFAQV